MGQHRRRHWHLRRDKYRYEYASTGLVLPAMAFVVGLHFLPIAYGTGVRAYYMLGAALIAVASIGIAMPSPSGGAFSGVAAAACLWSASVIAVLQDGGMTLIRARSV
jgi:hypothetical protein